MILNPATIAAAQAAISGAIKAIQFIVKQVKEWRASGLITEAQQHEILGRIGAMRDGSAFEGPEWEPAPDRPTPP